MKQIIVIKANIDKEITKQYILDTLREDFGYWRDIEVMTL